MIKAGHNAFLVLGDVYRRDTIGKCIYNFNIISIDKTHYPAFHQMEGVRVLNFDDIGATSIEHAKKIAEIDLKQTLEGLSKYIFSKGQESLENPEPLQMRWVDENFPFTDPSLELEIFYKNDWMEILGSGVIHDQVMINAGRDINKEVGWAFGLGLERWCMRLFGIHDIRLFWSKDERFLNQFEAGKITEFKEYSKYPPCFKDISFWTDENYDENSFFEIVRDNSGDMVESVECVDTFQHPKNNKVSK